MTAGNPPIGWEAQLLKSLGAPVTTANKQFFDVWAVAEHGPGGWGGYDQGGAYNPFDTSLDEPGSTDYNQFSGGGGVQSYPNWKTGKQATVSTLQQSNMAPLYNALVGGQASVEQLETAEGQTPWGHEAGWPSVGSKPATGTLTSYVPGVSKASTKAGAAADTFWCKINVPGVPGPSVFGWHPLGNSIGGGTFTDIARMMIALVFIVVGLILVAIGIDKTFSGGGEKQPAPTPSPTKNVEHDAEHADEAAAVA